MLTWRTIVSDNLSNFLVDVASNPDRMASFAANPLGELDRAPLTADERAVVLAGDSAGIRQALGGQAGGQGGIRKKKGAKKATKKRPASKKKK